jgi:hypothetical protein
VKETPQINNRDNIAAQIVHSPHKGSGVRHKGKFVGFGDLLDIHYVNAIGFSRKRKGDHFEIDRIDPFLLLLQIRV